MLFMRKEFSYLCTHNFQLTKIMNNFSLQTKLETLPPELKIEVNKFVDLLIEKSAKHKQFRYLEILNGENGQLVSH